MQNQGESSFVTSTSTKINTVFRREVISKVDFSIFRIVLHNFASKWSVTKAKTK